MDGLIKLSTRSWHFKLQQWVYGSHAPTPQTMLLWGSLKAFFSFMKGFFGIFGAYFSADYKGYCPGIEWEDAG